MKAKGILALACCSMLVGIVSGAAWHKAQLFPFQQISRLKSRLRDLPQQGRWNPARKILDSDQVVLERESEIQRLQSIGYIAGSQAAPTKEGVILHDTERAYPGLNLVVSGHAPEATLMDMSGREIHRWSCDIHKAWPDFRAEDFFGKNRKRIQTWWRRAHLMENGDLLVIFEGIGLVKLDKESNVVWSLRNGAHHDVYVAANGLVYLLTRRAHIDPKHNPEEPILEDFITVLTPDGEKKSEISILQALRNSMFSSILGRLEPSGDILHMNTIELVENVADNSDISWLSGTALVSIRNLDLVCFVDIRKESVVWAESDLWHRQHQPTLLDNGNILVLDNRSSASTSSVVEIDPNSREILWSYVGGLDGPFFTGSVGSCQRLRNGNTLITETDYGRAFEVTPDKKIVWEYLNPHRAGKEGELIASLMDVVRLESSPFWLRTP
jgi:hypothetical protein